MLRPDDTTEAGSRRFRFLEAGIAALFFGVFTVLLLSGSLDGLENRTLDWRYRTRPLQEPKAKIALVLITEDCLPRLGSWPLSRSFYATAIDRLASAGAKIIAFDIMFEEASSADLQGDDAFVESCRRFGRVLFPQVFYEGYEDSSLTKRNENFSIPFDKLADSAAGFGYINADFDYLNPDGILQKMFLTHKFEEEWYRCYSLAIAEQFTGQRAVITDGGVTLGNTTIPLIDLPPWKPIKSLWHGGTGKAVYINFLGDKKREPFPSCLFSDLVQGASMSATFRDVFAPSIRHDASVFRDAIVFVGPSAKGLGDLRITPHGLKPGVIVHANLLENILASNFLEAPSIKTQVGLLAIFALFTFGILCWEGAFVASTAAFGGILALYAGFCFHVFSGRRLVFPMTIPLLMAIGQYVVVRFVQLIANLKRANAILSEQNIKLDQKVQELMALHSAGSRFPAILEMSILSQEVISKFCELRGADAGLLVFFEPQTGQAQPLGQVAGARGETYIQEYRTELAERLRTVFETKRPLTVSGSHLYSSYMPLLVGEACWGAVCLHDTDADRLPWQSENFWTTLLGISGTALQNARLYEMAREVSLARQVQANFLPKKPLELNGYRVFGHSRPATQLGGDYFDYFVVDDRHLVVMIADVMGHGVPAALGMAIVKTSVLQRAKEGFSVENLVNTINYTLLNSQERRLMVTAQFTVIDTHEHRATIYHRGHVFPFRRSANGTWGQQRCTIAPPLGVMKQAPTPGTPVEILPGERWMFYTDGLYESLGEGKEDEMKIAALQTYLGTRPLIPLIDACSDILDHHPSFLTGQPQPDDYTVLLLEREQADG
ncbi:MAG: Phosphoserine phosphatase RsbP [bacterium ADurb.Bin374]|nr:MAG: Phosphoserine phosphatase RsbP [bacterium ADurb.Bin374]